MLSSQGIVWWGAESSRAVPGGLERRSLEDLLAQLSHYGFNAIKLPFLHQHVLFDDYLPASSFDTRLNPMLTENGRPLKYVAMLRALARRSLHPFTMWGITFCSIATTIVPPEGIVCTFSMTQLKRLLKGR